MPVRRNKKYLSFGGDGNQVNINRSDYTMQSISQWFIPCLYKNRADIFLHNRIKKKIKQYKTANYDL